MMGQVPHVNFFLILNRNFYVADCVGPAASGHFLEVLLSVLTPEQIKFIQVSMLAQCQEQKRFRVLMKLIWTLKRILSFLFFLKKAWKVKTDKKLMSFSRYAFSRRLKQVFGAIQYQEDTMPVHKKTKPFGDMSFSSSSTDVQVFIMHYLTMHKIILIKASHASYLGPFSLALGFAYCIMHKSNYYSPSPALCVMRTCGLLYPPKVLLIWKPPSLAGQCPFRPK